MATRIGVDVGGTFTDVIFYDDETGEVRVAKEPTTPAAPEQGVMSAVHAGVPDELIRASSYFLHGMTAGLNALLTRTGATVGLLATRGFRDVLEVRRGDRGDPYSLFWKPPPALVPRRLRLPVTERIRADGVVHRPLIEDDIAEALEIFREEGVTSIAISYLHSYANPTHELATEEALRELGFDGEISLSHQVSGEYREFERTSTTVIDAFVRPGTSTYLGALDEQLAGAGFGGTLLVTRSGGGAMTFEEARARPFETILSGPVAGAEGAAELARSLELGDVISADVGGTSFDACLIIGGHPQMLYQGKVIGLPIQMPWVDVRSIGAGGGSIAYVDQGGLLRVGPQSAGAVPGPAGYGRGGTRPTVTDAAFVLGMMAGRTLAGDIEYDTELSVNAFSPLAESLGLGVEQVAQGTLTIANANMANTIREITIDQGHDPRQAKLIPFGGAGALFATLLARELELTEIVVPPYGGNFSAWGLLGADLRRTAALTRVLPLEQESIDEANQMLAGLFEELEARVGSDDAPGSRREVNLDMRYLGQEHTLTIEAEADEGGITQGPESIRETFTRDYLRTFGLTMEEEAQIVSVRATTRAGLPRRRDIGAWQTDASDAAPGSVSAYSFTRQEWLDFAVLERFSLAPETVIDEPAIILEDTSTTYLDAEFTARVDPSGCIFISDTGGS